MRDYDLVVMATRREHPERYGWWIVVKRTNKFNNLRETRSLVEDMKHDLYQHDKPHSL